MHPPHLVPESGAAAFIMNKFNTFKKLVISTAVMACLCSTAFAAETSGDADPDDMWAATHPITSVSPYDTASDTDEGNWYKQANKAYAEYVQREKEEAVIPPAGILGMGNVDGINFWAEASDNSDLLGTISKGQEVTVLERNGDWCRVSCDGQIGYVKSARISTCGLPLDCTNGKIVNGGGELYQEPSENSALVTRISEGTSVTLLSFENGWYAASCGTSNGYIRAEFVEADSGADNSVFIDPAPVPTAETPFAEEEQESDLGERIVAKAKEYMGTRYVYGGSTPSGFDCSGFTMYVLGQLGYDIPHSATSQWSSVGTAVDRSELQAGDLVFFKDPSRSRGKACSHVGIYIGDGDFIHAASGSSSGRQVRISNLSENYYNGYYKGAKRI